jgi:chromosome segregation ATPase
MLPLFLLLLTQTPSQPASQPPVAPVQLPTEVANALRQTIASILALAEKGTLCSAAVRDAESARSVVNRDIEEKRKEGSGIDTDIAAIDQQLRGMRLSPERTELTTKRRNLENQRREVDRSLQQNPPSALMKRFLQVETDIANYRQCVSKARADLDGFVLSLAPKAKP